MPLLTLHQRLELEARKHYEELTPAFAYIYEHHHDHEVRVEAPHLMRAFSKTIPFGRDISGFLYFYGVSDFEGEMQYQVSVERSVEADGVKEQVMVINFWSKEEATTCDPYAKFIALVPVHAWDKFVPFKKVGGQWNDLDQVEITGRAVSSTTHVTITLHPLATKFHFHIPHCEKLPETGFDCHGPLVTKDIKELATGREFHVDYTNTRIMILEKQHYRAVATFTPIHQEGDNPLFDLAFRTRGKFSHIHSGDPFSTELGQHAE